MNLEPIDQNEKTTSFDVSLNEKSKSTAWLIRCSAEQKEFFQKVASESGKNVADFISSALETYKLKNTVEKNSKIHKEIQESEYLIERLNNLIKSKIYYLAEQENYLKSEISDVNDKKCVLEESYEKLETELQLKFEKKEIDFQHKIEEMRTFFSNELDINLKEKDEYINSLNKNNNEEKFTLQKKIDLLQDTLLKKNQDFLLLERQLADLTKLNETSEMRCSDLKKMLEKTELENSELKKQQDNWLQSKKTVDDLNHKIELLNVTHEQEIKRLNMEFDFRLKLKEQELESCLKKE